MARATARQAQQGRRYGCSLTRPSTLAGSLAAGLKSGTFSEVKKKGTEKCIHLTEESRYGVVVQVQKNSVDSIHHPVRSIKGSFAIFFLVSRPPLLARRGDGSPYDFFTASMTAHDFEAERFQRERAASGTACSSRSSGRSRNSSYRRVLSKQAGAFPRSAFRQ